MNILRRVLNESLDMSNVLSMPFIKEIKSMGGDIVVIGGAVRDELLSKNSKDIDLLVTGVQIDNLISILEKFGKVDLVGKSFGVLKFNPNGYDLDEPIDIALPREERVMTDIEKDNIEKKTGKRPTGYQAFVTDSNHKLQIKDDLLRRDFTINSITKKPNGELYDPFNGKKDLENKIIRMVSPNSFSDDPLRILRGIQFASRFGFKIERRTWEEMKKNSNRIKEISGERILIELEKIVKKGDTLLGFKLLIKSGVYDSIFGTHFEKFIGNINLVKNAKTLSEFIYSIIQDSIKDISRIHLNILKGDLDTAKEIECLELAWKNKNVSKLNSRLIAFKLYKITYSSFKLTLYPNNIKNAIKDLETKYPKSLKDLEVNGNDLMNMGVHGKEISEMFNRIMIEIYSDKLKNKKENLIKFISRKNF